jgi:ribosomal protein L7/L12
MQELIVGMIIGAIGFGVAAAVKRSQERNSALKLGEARDSGKSLRQISLEEGYVGDTAEVMALMQQGKKIEAIKLVRLMTGLGLKEAKDLVDKMSRGISVDLTSKKRDDAGG